MCSGQHRGLCFRVSSLQIRDQVLLVFSAAHLYLTTTSFFCTKGKIKILDYQLGQKLMQALNKVFLTSFDASVAFIAYLLVLWSFFMYTMRSSATHFSNVFRLFT